MVDSFNEKAIRKLYRIKKRPRSKPFTILINSFKDLSKFDVEVSANARAILKKSWPGPLTAVLNTKTEKKLGFRMPRYKAINMLLRESKLSVFAPSANISGKKECTNIEDIASDFSSKVDLIVDAGISPIGIASTVIDLTSDKLRILRKGALKIREIKI